MLKKLLSTAAMLAGATTASAQYWADSTANPVVLQIGTGATTVSGTGYAITAKQYVFGVASQATAGSTAAFASVSNPGRIVLSASATSEGLMTNSFDRSNIVFAGYDAATGTANVNNAANNANRVVGFADLNATGLAGTSTTAYPQTQATAYNANNIRSAVALGGPTSDTWTGGTGGTASTGGVRYIPTNTQVSSSVTNIRSVDVYSNQLFLSSASGAFVGISTVGTGTPSTSGNTTTLLFATGTGSSPYEFVGLTDLRVSSPNLPAAAAGNNVFYVADDRTGAGGGIQRWTWNGTAWNLDYTITVGGAFGARGLAGYTDPFSGNAVLYASRSDGTQLLQFTDQGSQAGAEASKVILATADTNTVFRGVALAVPEPGLLGLAALGLLRRRRLS